MGGEAYGVVGYLDIGCSIRWIYNFVTVFMYKLNIAQEDLVKCQVDKG